MRFKLDFCRDERIQRIWNISLAVTEKDSLLLAAMMAMINARMVKNRKRKTLIRLIITQIVSITPQNPHVLMDLFVKRDSQSPPFIYRRPKLFIFNDKKSSEKDF